MIFDQKKAFFYYLICAILLGFIINIPYLDFQFGLAQGDHGRDLYAFWATSNGATPYQDYWWDYGPLMPYYYGSMLRFLGDSLHTVMFGRILLQVCSGVFFFFTLYVLSEASIAFIGTLWFLVFFPYFPHTYTYDGAFPLMLLTILNVVLYLHTKKWVHVAFSLFAVIMIGLIKINFGVSTLAATILCLGLIDIYRYKTFNYQTIIKLLSLVFLCAVIWAAIYSAFLNNLKPSYVLQNLHYTSQYEVRGVAAPLSLLKKYFQYFSLVVASRKIISVFSVIIFICGLISINKFRLKDQDMCQGNPILGLVIPVIFMLSNAHEFLLTGVLYRADWVRPFSLLSAFYIIYLGTKAFPKITRQAVIVLIVGMSLYAYAKCVNWMSQTKATPEYDYILSNKKPFFTMNSSVWTRTVYQTQQFLSEHLSDHETFFVLPYDPLYYYLLKRQSPVRYLFFGETMHFSIEDQQEIIAALGKKKINYILQSNRIRSHEIGVFGETYAEILADYIENNYTEIFRTGEWDKEALHVEHHGVRILQRKKIF